MSVIFYFSGTGNSLDAAKQIASVLKDCRLEPMSSYLHKPYSVKDEVVGIVCPVYCWSLPPFVQDFLAKLDAAPQYTFGVVTMGGAQGRALKLLQELLAARGITLNYANTIIMPDNIFNTPELKAAQLLTEADQHLASIISAVHEQQSDTSKCVESYLWKYAGTALVWWYLRHISHAGVFSLDYDACVGCGQCAKVCPAGNIRMLNGRPEFGRECASCFACVNWCPKQAIRMGRINKPGEKRYTNPNIKIQELFRQEEKL